jgi:predicted SnoaL-like aldol condensation-catalyzing enzyme
MTVIYRSIPVTPHWSQSSNAKEERENYNKNRVLSFMKELFGDKDVNAIDRYVAEKYVQHNPTVRDGKRAFKAAATEWFAGAPKESLDIRRVAADDDMVWVHWRAVEGNDTQAVVDIFRVDKGMIAEHWDVIQTVPRQSMNSNSLF